MTMSTFRDILYAFKTVLDTRSEWCHFLSMTPTEVCYSVYPAPSRGGVRMRRYRKLQDGLHLTCPIEDDPKGSLKSTILDMKTQLDNLYSLYDQHREVFGERYGPYVLDTSIKETLPKKVSFLTSSEIEEFAQILSRYPTWQIAIDDDETRLSIMINDAHWTVCDETFKGDFTKQYYAMSFKTMSSPVTLRCRRYVTLPSEDLKITISDQIGYLAKKLRTTRKHILDLLSQPFDRRNKEHGRITRLLYKKKHVGVEWTTEQ